MKRTGEIPPITNRQDTGIAELVVGATFREGSNGYEPEVLGMVPPTGTRVFRVDQPLLDKLLSVYMQEIVYLGKAYANDVFYPMWFKHFGSGPQGVGEAYHLAVVSSARGAFNIAAEPVVGARELAAVLQSRPVTVPPAVARAAMAARSTSSSVAFGRP